MFKISETHSAATWLLDPRAPKIDMPDELRRRIARMLSDAKKEDAEAAAAKSKEAAGAAAEAQEKARKEGEADGSKL